VKAYRFRLARLLELRRLKQQAAEAELQRALAEVRAAEARAARLADEQTELTAREASRASWTGRELAAAERWRESLNDQRRRALAAGEVAQRRVAALRQNFQQARNGVRVLESLDERRRRAWNAEAGRAEEALASELFLGRWKR
jgi:flagellar export protein FliJ